MGLREQAKLDARAILEDLSGFAWPVTLTSPLGVVSSVYGFTTDVGQTIDPETGQAVAGRRASFAVARASLPELPEAVAEATRKPWLASFADSQGVFAAWKVIEVLPDRAAGVVVLLLETFQRAIVHLTGALALPSGLELAGTVAPEVELAGALELPSLALEGTVAPEVELAGALELPSLALEGTVAPAVGDLAGALTLPSLALSGTVAPVVGDLTGALALPSLALSGTVAPAVSMSGSLTLPSLALSGTVAPAVSMSGSLTLPSLALSGTYTVSTSKITGWLRLASSLQSGGEWTPSIVDVLNPGSPMVQTDVDRRTAVGVSGNGYPTMVFDGTDVHLWPQSPGHSSTTKIGIWMWFKPATNGGGIQWIYSVLNGVGGSTTNRLRVGFFNGRIYSEVYVSNTDGRSLTSAATPLPLNGVWYAIYIQYDSSRGGDANLAVYVDGVSIALTGAVAAGAGSTLGALQAASGSATVGGFNDNDTPTQPITNGGEIGPNIFAFNDNLTAAEITSFLGFEVPVFIPTEVSALAAWLRLSLGTITGSGYSSVPDSLASNPAVQTTDASRPPNLNSANGLPRADFDGSADHLSWPAAANNNQTVTAGFAAWVEFDSVPASQWGIFCGVPGATNRVEVTQFNAGILIDVFISQFSARRGTKTSAFAAATKYFLTWEYDGAGATEADKCTVTINGVVQTLAFSDSSGAPGAMPATLVSTAGPFFIGARTAALGFLNGKIGPNIYTLGSKMSGATVGLLTTAARAGLMNYEKPT